MRNSNSYFCALRINIVCLIVNALLWSVGIAQEDSGFNRLLDAYTRTAGEDPEIVAKMRPDAIPELVERLRNATEARRKAYLVLVVGKAIEQIPANQSFKNIGRTAIYELLRSDDAIVRQSAVDCIGRMDKELATSTLLKMVNDPDQTVRIIAIESLADNGSPGAASLLEQVLKDRALGLSADDMRKDHSFEFGRAAIDRLRARAENPGVTFPPIGEPQLQPLVKPKRVPILTPAPGVRELPKASPAVVTTTASQTPARETPAPIANPLVENTSSVWPWLVGIGAFIVIVALALKRRA